MELENNEVEVSDESTKVDAESFYEQTDETESEETASESESEDSSEDSGTIVDGNIESDDSESKEEEGSEEEEADSSESKDDKEGSFELNLPEKSHLSKEDVAKFAEFAKENDMSEDVAQKVLEQRSEAIDSFVSHALEKQTELHESWRQETLNDPELGGENLVATSENSKRALNKFGTPELTKMLRDGKFGNNIEVVRFMNNIGKAMGDDKMIFGSGKTKTEQSFEDKFYNAKK